MQLDIPARLTPQVTIIIFHYIKKLLLLKKTIYGGLDQNPYTNKNDIKVNYTYS